jgi:hypothetical protein
MAAKSRLLFRRNEYGLVIPAHYQKVINRPGPTRAVFYEFHTATGHHAVTEDWTGVLARLPRETAVLHLAAINIALAEDKASPDLQEFLSERYLGANRRASLVAWARQHGEEGGPDLRVLFHRGGILAALKALLAFGRPADPGNFELDAIGDLALIANERVAGGGEPQVDVDLWVLAATFLPSWELYNPPDWGYGLARMRILLRLLFGNEPKVATARGTLGIDPEAWSIDGLSARDFLDVVVGLAALGRSRKASIADPQHAPFDRAVLVRDLRFPPEQLEAFLKSRSCTVEDFRSRLADGRPLGTSVFDAKFGAHFLVFKETPLLHLDDGQDLILDEHFLAELALTGPFWSVFNALPSEGKSRPGFLALWGVVFELYVWRLLRSRYPEAAGILTVGTEYRGGEVDALLDLGPHVVVIEAKAALITQPTKYSKDSVLLRKELVKKFVEDGDEPKGVRQLANAVAALNDGRLRTAVRPAVVYPVLIGLEPGLESAAMNSILDSEFQRFKPPTQGMHVRPLTVLSIEELETLIPLLDHVDWPSIIDERYANGLVPLWSFGETCLQVSRARELPLVRNQELRDVVDGEFQEILSRFRADT